MRVSPKISVEEIRAGTFVVVDGLQNQFFCMITNVKLEAANQEILQNPPQNPQNILNSVLAGNQTFATVELKPMLMLPYPKELDGTEEIFPVKTIPPHFSPVFNAREKEVSRIFGSEELGEKFFNIGKPLEMETPVCLNLEKFVERSNGIFGKTGTGKTFLTRIALCGLISRNKAVNLIFDMHSEYGWVGSNESGNAVKGLKQIFPNKVVVATLDPETTRKKTPKVDIDVTISLDEIEPEDIFSLADELKLNETALETMGLLQAKFKENWLEELLNNGITKEFATLVGAHNESLGALARKLLRIKSLPFVATKDKADKSFTEILSCLKNGKSVVLEFGRRTNILDYLLVSNILTRKIHSSYTTIAEDYYANPEKNTKPTPLVITIEEAHRFLNPVTAKQTAFGMIAREMRKYFVTLLVVDQRPSGIYDEVLSQLGTRITALLNDEKDIAAVLTGVSGAVSLRSVLASLDTKQQALILGYAVPMPVVIQTRIFDEKFYQEIAQTEKGVKIDKSKPMKNDVDGVF
ncbi:ATP-binding protein [bacterium]|nr:ATP-binding protein [bacterium]